MKRIVFLMMVAAVAVAGAAQQMEFAPVVAPVVPQKVEFCGSEVNFDRLDMADRLDRELLSIMYSHSNTMLSLKRANRYFPVFSRILKEQGIPQDMLYLAVTESLLDPLAYSTAKAAGTWQMLAETGRQFGLEVNDEVDERYDPEKSCVAACKLLRQAYNKYGDWPSACASYNAGQGRISGELSKQGQNTSFDLYLNKETSRYVFRIIAYKLFFENPQAYGYRLTSDQLWQPVRYREVQVTSSVPDWAAWARQQGISYAQLREANPWIRSTHLTVRTKTYTVRIPLEEDRQRSTQPVSVFNKAWVTDK